MTMVIAAAMLIGHCISGSLMKFDALTIVSKCSIEYDESHIMFFLVQ